VIDLVQSRFFCELFLSKIFMLSKPEKNNIWMKKKLNKNLEIIYK